MYKLIAIDIDGTLLNSEKQISDEDKKAVRQAIDIGVKVVVCSGRIYAGARIFARQLGVTEPLIACNGAIIRDMDTDELLYSNLLKDEDCYKVIDTCHKENIYFHVYVDDTMYTERLEGSSLFYWQKNQELPQKDQVDIKVVENVTQVLKERDRPATKIVVISENIDLLSRTRKCLEEIKTIEIMSSNYNNFEVVNYGVNKGNALKFLCDKLNIMKEEIIAVGDNENDFSMIEFAGLGIAMGNAEEFIKENADYVTLSNNENGVAQVIKKFVLQRL